MNVLLLNTKSHNPNYYIVLGIENALKESAKVRNVQNASYKDVVQYACTGDYDVLLAVDGEDIAVDILTRLHSLIPVTALWAFEDPYERSKTSAVSGLFDLIFTNDSASVDYYTFGAQHLSLAANPKIDHRPVRLSDSDYEYDVSFVGSAWPNRVKFLRRLLKRMPDLKTRIVLAYNPYLPRAYLDLPDSSYIGSVSHYDFVEIANRSRVSLTLHRDFSGDGINTRAADPGPRIFETALAGGFQLIDAADTRLDVAYRPGQDVETFVTFDECITKLDDALRNPHRRIEMANAAQSRTRDSHLYAHRVDKILESAAVSLATKKVHHPITDVDQDRVLGKAQVKPRLLFVTHNTIAGGNFGGVEVYQESIATKLSKTYELFYYRVSRKQNDPAYREYVLTNDRHRVLERVLVPYFDIFHTLTSPIVEQAFAHILAKYKIDIIHYHHLINHIVSLPLVSKMMGVPSVYTTQDFFLVCTRFNLVDFRGSYCNIAKRTKEVCDVCLSAAEGKAPGTQGYRRAFISRVLGAIDKVIANSSSAREVIGGVYPELEDRNAFVPFGLPLPKVGPVPFNTLSRDKRSFDGKDVLKVVFLGNFTKIKGADMFLRVAEIMRNDAVEFTICGRLDEPFPSILAQLDLPNVKVHGGFDPGELDLSVFDMSLHLSIWPETYCITLSEAWKAGVVPVVTACGALLDRVTHNVNGFHIPIDGAGELISILRRVIGDRTELNRILANVSPSLWLTVDEHCDKLTEVYQDLLATRTVNQHSDIEPRIDNGVVLSTLLLDEPINGPRWDEPILNFAGFGAYEPLNPYWADRQAILALLSAGRSRISPEATVWIDHFGASVPHLPRDGATIIPVATGTSLQLSGWLRAGRGEIEGNKILALRSLNGDLVLVRLHLFDRPDVVAVSDSDADCVGFTSEPIPQALFDSGVYGVEIFKYDNESVVIFRADAAIVVRDKVEVAQGNNYLGHHLTLGVPLEGAPWIRDSKSKAVVQLTVDKMSIEKMSSEGDGHPLWTMFVYGWAIDLHADDAADTMLHLRGDLSYHTALRWMARPDVVSALAPIPASNVGFVGAAWLADIQPGYYEVDIQRRSRSGVSVMPTEHILEVRVDAPPVVSSGKREMDVLASERN